MTPASSPRHLPPAPGQGAPPATPSRSASDAAPAHNAAPSRSLDAGSAGTAPTRHAPPAVHLADTVSVAADSRERTSQRPRAGRHAIAPAGHGGVSRAALHDRAVGTPVAHRTAAPSLWTVAATPKPYLYAEQLAELTPWSVEAINTKVKRGELRHGVHYFQEYGRGRRIFKWAAIVDAIEGREAPSGQGTTTQGVETDYAKATAELQRLLD